MNYAEKQTASGLRVGDKVCIKRIAAHMEKGWNNTWPVEMDKHIGHVGNIKNINNYGIQIEDCDTFRFPYFILKKEEEDFETADKVWTFAQKNLASPGNFQKTPIMEENMEYTATDKEITLNNLFNEVCSDWKDTLVRKFGVKYGFYGTIPLNEAVLFATNHGEDVWLEEHGYIAEEKEEITYKIGDWFEAHGEKYWLVQVGNCTVNLLDFDSANRKTDPVRVKDIYKITQEEFNKLGSHIKKLKKINVEIKEVP